jgi:hypothetical protein
MIRELMDPAESQPYSEGESQKPKHCQLATIAQMGKPRNFVGWVTGPKEIEAVREYLRPSGTPHTGLCAECFADMLEHYCTWCKQDGGKLPKYLILDRHPSHIADSVHKAAERLGLTLKPLPPRSPDLQPLDTHFFAQVKKSVRAEVERRLQSGSTCTAAEQFRLFEQKLRETNPANHIRHYRLRLQACKEAKGKHFERQYKALKAKAEAK